MITLLLALLVALSPTTTYAAFKDVGNLSPYGRGIDYVRDRGFVQGYSDGTFKPDNTINRAEFVKILMEAVGPIEFKQCERADFSDIDTSAWYTDYISTALCMGVISGYPDGTFRPADPINFAEAAKIIVKAFHEQVSEETGEEWFAPYVRSLEHRRAIPIQILTAGSPLTRGQMAEMIYRLDADVETEDSKTYDDLVGVSENGLLPLGDNKYSTEPRKGYIYSCQTRFGGSGAFRDGEWIQGDYWDPSLKPVVDGNNVWSNARFSLTENGSTRTLTSNGLPTEGTTGNYPVSSTDDAYNYDRNPNSIQTQTIELNLPVNPTLADSPSCVPMGLIGVALNGVAIFNGFDAGGRDAAAHEILDSCEGHPQQSGMYHYHRGSDCIDDENGLIGYAIDGFGIYKSDTLTSADLDECHGTTSTVLWNGSYQDIYHYVLTADYPYTVGCFRGTPANTGNLGNDTQMKQGPEGMMGPPQGNGGNRMGPPEAALTSCSNSREGDSCSFSDRGHTISGTCRTVPEGAFACVPAR